VPAYLATSPISPSSLSQMEAGLAAMKAASALPVVQDDPVTPVVEHSGTIVSVEDGKMVVSGIPPSGTLLSAAVVDERQYFSDSEVPCGSSTGRRRRQNATVATQTHITASDVDCIRNERCATPPGEWYSGLSSTERDNSPAEGSSESTALQSSDVTLANSSPPMAASHSSNLLVNRIDEPNRSAGSSEKNMSTRARAEDCLFEMEMSSDDEAGQGTPTLSLVTESTMFGRCASMPSIHRQKGFDESTDAWAASQYMSTAMNDYTPTTRYYTVTVHLLGCLEEYHDSVVAVWLSGNVAVAFNQHSCFTSSPVSTGMGHHLWTSKPSWYVTSHTGQFIVSMWCSLFPTDFVLTLKI